MKPPTPRRTNPRTAYPIAKLDASLTIGSNRLVVCGSDFGRLHYKSGETRVCRHSFLRHAYTRSLFNHPFLNRGP